MIIKLGDPKYREIRSLWVDGYDGASRVEFGRKHGFKWETTDIPEYQMEFINESAYLEFKLKYL